MLIFLWFINWGVNNDVKMMSNRFYKLLRDLFFRICGFFFRLGILFLLIIFIRSLFLLGFFRLDTESDLIIRILHALVGDNSTNIVYEVSWVNTPFIGVFYEASVA